VTKTYGLKSSEWNPNQSIEALFKRLSERGPMLVCGYFGKNYYVDPPIELKNEQLTKRVFGWKPNSTRINNLEPHVIILIGVIKPDANNPKGCIYYLDPSDIDDPQKPEADLMYRMSYQNLVTNSKKFEFMDNYTISL
jgi:hypothetical protein